MNSLLTTSSQKKYSAERLRYLYATLLQQIDIANEALSRRGMEATTPKSPRRFSLRKSIFPQRDSHGEDSDDERTAQRKRDLAAAFRLLAATRSADKEGSNGGAVAVRDDASVSALALAQSLESSVVDLIRLIGEVVVNAEQQTSSAHDNHGLRSDDAFEYFCEKTILALLVDIVKDKPGGAKNQKSNSCFHGVVWSPAVKAQVLQTVSLLVSGMRDDSALYYILSQNCINELITCIMPLQQWTGPALEVMLPAYVDLLKNLSLQLGGSPQLFPFFTIQQQDGKENQVLFPLFSAILETGTSSYAQSDSFVHAACLNLIVSLMGISSYPPIQDWVSKAEQEQRHLANHLCQLLLRRFQRIVDLTTGPVVDATRSNSIASQLASLNDETEVLNDVFWCGIRGFNVRLCEALLRQVVSLLLKNLLPSQIRHFLVVGVMDHDVVPHQETLAQVSTVVLSRLFLRLEYGPFVRMLAVALLHPQSLPIWESEDLTTTTDDGDEYVVTPALNALVQGKATDCRPNPYRTELIKALRGDYGEWRVVSAAVHFEYAIMSESLDPATLAMLELLPRDVDRSEYEAASIEVALGSFLTREHSRMSAVSTVSLECASSLAVQLLYKIAMGMTDSGKDLRLFSLEFLQSPLWRALLSARSYFFRRTLDSQQAIGVSDIFVDLIEAAVQARYKRITIPVQGVRSGPRVPAYVLSHHGCAVHGTGSEVLIRKRRGVDLNDVESTRFYAQMALHFRAICRVVERFRIEMENGGGDGTKAKTGALPELDLVDKADDLCQIFGGLGEKPTVGTDLDLRGRMTFRFSSGLRGQERSTPKTMSGDDGRMRTFSDDMIFRSTTRLVLVLDPTDMFVVKPFTRTEVNRGTIVCSVPLLDVIAAAADGEWLHVAVRHDDVGFLIKNGNMPLCVESAGTCLIVRQYLDRCRQVLRRELLEKIRTLFTDDHDEEDRSEDAATVTRAPTL